MGDAIGSRRRPRGARGQSMIEYALIIAVISLVVVFVGPSLSQAITQQFEKIVETLGGSISWPGANPGQPGGGQRPDPNPTPDPEKPGGGGEGVDPDKPITAFAVFSADDGSLNFYKRSEVPAAGSQFEGKTATEVYTGIETNAATDLNQIPWRERVDSITSCTVVDVTKPVSTAFWFGFCRNLTTIDMARLDTSSVRSMSHMFTTCDSIKSLDISSFDTSSVTDMSSMFKNCAALSSLDMSKVHTSSVIDMSKLFMNCIALTTLDISSFDTSSVTNMASMFNGCINLKSINLARIETGSTTDMSKMFRGCTSLQTLDISSFDTSSATNMASMFTDCEYLQRVTLGSKFAWVGSNGYLPAPHRNQIAGADGKWYSASNGTGYEVAEIPSNKADTYVASREMLPKMEAFAVFSADDGSLNFYKRSKVPVAGSQFEGKTATEVYTGIEDGTCYDDGVYVKWESRLNSREIRFVCVKDAISPGRMQNWFRNSALEEVDFTLLDTSSTRGKDWLFDGCSDLRILRIGENFDWRGRSCRPPAPSASQIPGADGKWYNSKGTGFAPADIPSNVADTYYASRDLVPSNGFSLLKMIEDGVHALMGFFAPRN